MVDVARAAGVSLKTVSRVVNDVPTVHPDLTERVLAAATQLGFRRNHIARTLRAGRSTATIGLLIEDLANPFYSAIAAEVSATARGHETALITASSEEDPTAARDLLLDLCQRRVDGLIVVPAGYDHAFLRPEVEMGTPVVFLDRPAGGLLADTVLLDNRGGAREAVDHLLAEGHHRIGVLLDSADIYTTGERALGARDALGDAYDKSLVRYGAHDPALAAAAASELLDTADPPTAFFCANNRVTVGALGEIWRRRVDVAIAGFDDLELADLMPRPLTLVSYDTRSLARTAADALFRRIAGDTSPPATFTIPTRLSTRGPQPARP